MLCTYYQDLQSILHYNPELEVQDFIFNKNGRVYEMDDMSVDEIPLGQITGAMVYLQNKSTKELEAIVFMNIWWAKFVEYES